MQNIVTVQLVHERPFDLRNILVNIGFTLQFHRVANCTAAHCHGINIRFVNDNEFLQILLSDIADLNFHRIEIYEFVCIFSCGSLFCQRIVRPLHDVTLLYVCGLVYLAHSRLYLADDLLTLLRQQLLIILLHRLYKFGQFADTLVRLLRGDYLLYLFDNRKSIVLCLEILFSSFTRSTCDLALSKMLL